VKGGGYVPLLLKQFFCSSLLQEEKCNNRCFLSHSSAYSREIASQRINHRRRREKKEKKNREKEKKERGEIGFSFVGSTFFGKLIV
jgi:hypothetical protein